MPAPENPEDILPHRNLLVEDQKMNSIFTVDLLSSYGHQVDVAREGQEALQKLSRKTYDLVLMDIKMPGMDGRETTMRIRTADIDQGHWLFCASIKGENTHEQYL